MNDVESRLRTASTAAAARFSEAAAGSARRFARRAVADGLADVVFGVLDSPLGDLVAAVTRRGLVRLSYGADDLDRTLRELSALISPRILEGSTEIDPVRRQLHEYFEGRRTRFELAVDLSLTTGFGRRVLEAATKIPYGSVATYRDVATGAGSPAAVRAAGTALGRNPIPIVVPCHRVVRTGGGLGGYTGGLARKEALLALEGARAS